VATTNAVRRLLCRAHLWHSWKVLHQPDTAGSYQRCATCGKEKDVPPNVGSSVA
jgi:hypothetical protein